MFHSLFPSIFVFLVGEYVYSHLISASLFINLLPAWTVFFFSSWDTPHVIPRIWILHVVAFVDICVHLCVEGMPTFAGMLSVHPSFAN